MRPPPLLARLAAGLLLLAGTACIDDPPTGAGAPLGLALSIAGSAAQEASTIRVVPYFLDRTTGARVELPVTPAEFELPAPGAESRVSVRLDLCFREGLVEGEGSAFCPLRVELLLLGAEGDTLAVESQGVNVALGDPGPIRVPRFGLRAPGIGGVVRNAVTDEPIAGATVSLYAGTAPTGAAIATQTTSAGGAYAFAVSPGTYVLQATAGGFIVGIVGPVTLPVGTSVEADVVVSPTLGAGQTRIVLTWGATPRDLDSHLFGPASARSFHLYFSNRTVTGGAVPPDTLATLDVDRQEGFGPETITLLRQSAGSYRYVVHDFSNRASGVSAALSTSGARVRVFRGDALVAEFVVPNQPGTLWTVFDLNGTTITPIETMGFGTPTHPGGALGLHGAASRAAPSKPSLQRRARP